MVWVKLDDHFHDHEKVAALEPKLMLEAIGLNTLALTWCGRHLTDGVLPKGQPARLAGRPVENLIGELVRVGLWERVQGGFQIHDYLDYNPSRSQIEALRGKRAQAGKLGAESRWHGGTDGNSHSKCHRQEDLEPIANAMASVMASAMANGNENADFAMAKPMANGCPESRIDKKNIEAGTAVENSGDFRNLDLGEEAS